MTNCLLILIKKPQDSIKLIEILVFIRQSTEATYYFIRFFLMIFIPFFVAIVIDCSTICILLAVLLYEMLSTMFKHDVTQPGIFVKNL